MLQGMLYILVYLLYGTENHLACTSSHAPTSFFLISSLPVLKKGWHLPIIFQCCSLVMTATCSWKANQRVVPSSRNLHDSHVVGRNRLPSCSVRKVCSWHSTITTPPAPPAWKLLVSCQPCSWEPHSICTVFVLLWFCMKIRLSI